MATKSLEERVAALEKANKELQKSAKLGERAYAATECMKLISRYCYMTGPAKGSKWYDLSFAKKAPDIAIGHGQMGINVGKEKLDAMFSGRPPEMPEGLSRSRVGHCFLHPTASQLIEVAADGKTARGMFMSIGIESASDERGILTPAWGWGNYAVDFIKEDGEWKIWHFYIHRIFRGDFFQSWTVYNPDIEKGYYDMPEDKRYTKPPKDDSPYRPNREFVLKPDAPEPYETFDPADSYC